MKLIGKNISLYDSATNYTNVQSSTQNGGVYLILSDYFKGYIIGSIF